jgi:hypothetical protein
MEWQELMMDLFDRTAASLAQVLDGLSDEELNVQPAPDAGSIGLLAWQLSRCQDREISELMGKQQLWISESWYAVFGRNADAKETGQSFTIEQIQKFRAPDSVTVMKYHHDVLERIREYLGENLTEPVLETDSYSPTFGRSIPVYRRITGLINDGLQFVGQAAYVRGLLHGYDWQKRQ